MKTILKHMTSYLLTLLLLVSTLQVSVYKMDCLLSGKSVISLNDFENCNPTKSSKNTITKKCCCFHQLELNFDYDTEFNQDNTPIVPLVIVPFTIKKVEMVQPQIIAYNQSDLPPPGGIDFLKEIQVYRL